MRKRLLPVVLSLLIAVAMFGGYGLARGQKMMPFGGADDVQFATKVWKAMEGYTGWKMSSDIYAGVSPHGKFLRLYYNVVTVDGKPYHVIVKENYGGEGVTAKAVSKDPAKYLGAVTIMLQREPGYDKANHDWFWAKYKADGSIEKNPMGMALAGRVAKGMKKGCIACHANAKDGDYIFTNDE